MSSQKTPIALHLIFNILFNCSPPMNVVVSPTTLADWNVLLGEADKLILRKRFASSKYDFHVWSDDSNKGGEERHIVGVHTCCPEINKPRAYVLANSLTASGSGKHQSDPYQNVNMGHIWTKAGNYLEQNMGLLWILYVRFIWPG